MLFLSELRNISRVLSFSNMINKDTTHINKKFGIINNFLKSRREVLRPGGLRTAALEEVVLLFC